MKRNNENARWWTVLYVGKSSSKDEEGSYIWKLRDELQRLSIKVDLSQVQLYATPESETMITIVVAERQSENLELLGIAVGEVQDYTLYNENSNKRRIFQNFSRCQARDMVIGYESHPVKQIVAIAKISAEQDGEKLYF